MSVVYWHPSPLGLSPRGRGNHPSKRIPLHPFRSIPAWAGEPQTNPMKATLRAVYPRVGGGTEVYYIAALGLEGLSPRGRGNRRWWPAETACRRSIPAWAGEPDPGRFTATLQEVYPRVGGGTKSLAHHVTTLPGLSPRGRGNQFGDLWAAKTRRSIPAWAGEPAFAIMMASWFRVYPRVGGGTVAVLSVRARTWGLSPRGRGNPIGST